MTDKTPHAFADFTRRVVRSLAAGVACGAALAGVPAAAEDVRPAAGEELFDFAGDGPSRKYVTPASATSPAAAGGPAAGGDVGASGMGVAARAGHIAGNTVGRDSSLTHIEMMPYSIVGETMFFGDIRAWRLNNDGLGGNFGLGVRRFLPEWNKVLGANVFYDLDHARDDIEFEQLGLGLELLGENWDVRSNWYRPIGELTQMGDPRIVPGSGRFEGYRLLFSESVQTEAAAQGVDFMLTVPVRGEFFEKIDMEVGAGAYWYDSTDIETEALWGWRLRADAGLFNEVVHTFTELNVDDQTGAGVVFGVSLDYHGGIDVQRRLGRSQKNRLGEWVRRNYNVVALDQPIVTNDIAAINPADGEPYFIAHVDNEFLGGNLRAPAGDGGPRPVGPDRAGLFVDGAELGTFENPYRSILDAQTGSAEELDIIYVATGTTFSADDFEGGSLVLPDEARLFGEGLRSQTAFTEGTTFEEYLDNNLVVQHRIPVVGQADLLTLPSPTLEFQLDAGIANATNTSRPILRGLPGTAVTVGDDVEFRGFIVDGTDPDDATVTVTETGLLAEEVESGTYEDLFFNQTAGDGIAFLDAAGVFVMNNVQIGTFSGPLSLNAATPVPLIGTDPADINDATAAATGAGGVGLLVRGGTPTIRVDGNLFGEIDAPPGVGSLIANQSNYSVLIDGVLAGRIDLTNVNIVDVGRTGVDADGNPVELGGSGVRIRDNFNDTLFSSLYAVNSLPAPGEMELPGTPLAILRSAGSTTLTSDGFGVQIGVLSVDPDFPDRPAAGDAIVVEDLLVGGEFIGQRDSQISVEHSPFDFDVNEVGNATLSDVIALRMTRIAGTVRLDGSLEVNAPDFGDAADARALALTQPAVVFEASTGFGRVSNLTVENRGGGGLRVGDPEGTNRNLAGSSFELAGSNFFTDVGLLDIGSDPGDPTAPNAVIAHVGLVDEALGIDLPELSVFRGGSEIEVDDRGSVAYKVQHVHPTGRNFLEDIDVDDNPDRLLPSAVEITDNRTTVTVGSINVEDTQVNDNVIEINRNVRLDPADPLSVATVSIRDLVVVNADLDDSALGPNNFGTPVPAIGVGVGALPPESDDLVLVGAQLQSAVMILDNDDVLISGGGISVTDGRALTAANNLNTLTDSGLGESFLRFDDGGIIAEDAGDAAVFLSTNRGDVFIDGGNIEDAVRAFEIINQDGLVRIETIEIEDVGEAVTIINGQPDEPFSPAEIAPGTFGPVALDLTDPDDFDNLETQLQFLDSSVEDAFNGLVLTNIDLLDALDSEYDDIGNSAVTALVDTLNPDDLEYDYLIDNNLIDKTTLTGGAAISVIADAGGDNTTLLELDVTQNDIDGAVADVAVLVDWDGSTDIAVNENLIRTGSGVDVVDLDIGGYDGPLNGAVFLRVGDDNDGNFADIEIIGNDDTVASGIIQENFLSSAIYLQLDGVGDVDIDTNRITHTEDDQAVIRLGYDVAGSTTDITNNVITMQDGGRGIVVEETTPVTALAINVNLFQAVDRGILNFFNEAEFILRAEEPIVLSGTGNASDPFDLGVIDPVSLGNITGQFEVNGNLFP